MSGLDTSQELTDEASFEAEDDDQAPAEPPKPTEPAAHQTLDDDEGLDDPTG